MSALRRNLVPLLCIAFVTASVATGIFYGLLGNRLRDVSASAPRQPVVVAGVLGGLTRDLTVLRHRPFSEVSVNSECCQPAEPMGTHQTSVYIGTIAGGFFAGLIGQHFGWRSSFIIFGGCGILLGLILNRFLREPERGAADRAGLQTDAPVPQKRPHMSVGDFVKVIAGTPTVWFLMVAFMCENFTAMVLFTWMPTYLYQKFHLSLAMAGLTATLYVQLTSMLDFAVIPSSTWR